jgi:hypothetical protein
MRYSRMLEESSFANKKADYLWLLLLSSAMLLVRPPLIYAFMGLLDFGQLHRFSPRFLTFPSCPPPWPLSQYTFGLDDILRRPYPSLAYLPSLPHTFLSHWLLSRGPSMGRGKQPREI